MKIAGFRTRLPINSECIDLVVWAESILKSGELPDEYVVTGIEVPARWGGRERISLISSFEVRKGHPMYASIKAAFEDEKRLRETLTDENTLG